MYYLFHIMKFSDNNIKTIYAMSQKIIYKCINIMEYKLMCVMIFVMVNTSNWIWILE